MQGAQHASNKMPAYGLNLNAAFGEQFQKVSRGQLYFQHSAPRLVVRSVLVFGMSPGCGREKCVRFLH
jgi:hypothetical protein